MRTAEIDPSEGEADIDPEQEGTSEQLLEGSGPGVKVPDLSHLTKEEREALATDLDSYRFEVPREFQLLQMLQMMSPAAIPFLESEWHLLRFEGKILLTSDEPIILQRQPRPENQFLGIGPASADSLYIPAFALPLPSDDTCREFREPDCPRSPHGGGAQGQQRLNRHLVDAAFSPC